MPGPCAIHTRFPDACVARPRIAQRANGRRGEQPQTTTTNNNIPTNAQFKSLGYISLDPNVHSEYKARELKKVPMCGRACAANKLAREPEKVSVRAPVCMSQRPPLAHNATQVHVHAAAKFVRFRIQQCHVNKVNYFSQVHTNTHIHTRAHAHVACIAHAHAYPSPTRTRAKRWASWQ